MKIIFNTAKAILLASAMSALLLNCNSTPEIKDTVVKESPDKRIPPSSLAAPTEYATVAGKKIAYRSIGHGDPMIFCNRFRGVLDSWDPAFLDQLAKEFRVIIFDYSGIGLSSGELPTVIAEVAEDVKDLADFLKLDKFIIGGWSYGGTVAQTFSVRYPQMITHTILIGTNPPGQNPNPPEEIFLKTSAKPVNDLADEIILFFEPASAISREAAKLSHDRIAQRVNDKDIPVPVEKFARYFMGIADYAKDTMNAREKLGKLSTPLLCLSGDHDCVCPVENWYPLTRKMRNLQIIMLPDAGHGPQHQYVDLSVKYISDFINHTTVKK
ncbi:alpha/beta fold hydrolase [Lacibacter sediminis]|nr:alpha/beta hydrolase [Lacibacter sediminis]